MDKVYHDMGYYGSSSTGVVVIDNGVMEDRLNYFSVGPGGYSADGFFVKQWWNPNASNDGPHPMPYDAFSLWQYIEPSFEHGTRHE